MKLHIIINANQLTASHHNNYASNNISEVIGNLVVFEFENTGMNQMFLVQA